jgi:hypothetical protein
MPRIRVRPSPSADWRTEDLHALWRRTGTIKFDDLPVSLHQFLEYCRLLRSIKDQFETDDKRLQFDGCAFFLRGGYFAFCYLNLVSSMACRGTIFGGLNHGRHPKLEFPQFIAELRTRTQSTGRTRVELLIVDEVKSGTGMGTSLNLIEQAMESCPATSPCDINVHFYAIRQGSEDRMTGQLRTVVDKWQGGHQTSGGLLYVDIKHFAGPLLGYDDDQMCGIKTVHNKIDQKEAYELLKLSGGTVTFWCDHNRDQAVLQAPLDTNCIVEFLSACAIRWTSEPRSVLTENLARAIAARCCNTCRELFERALGRSSRLPNLRSEGD